MDVINKLCSSVHTTVSQLSGVLPGNNVTREYEVLEQVTTVGTGMRWKVYNGFKKTTKQSVSVFVFEKKIMDKYTKDDRESLLSVLRHGVHQLTKIKHPRILTVQHPLEESRDSLAFATEPVICSLNDVLGGSVSSSKKLFDVEIVHGFQQLIDGLTFLHCDANIVHGNLTPESILVNKQRSWKIFGFDFSVSKIADINKFGLSHSIARPCPDYMAPELMRGEEHVPESDTYSLGMLIYCVCTGRTITQSDIKQISNRPLDVYHMEKVPQELRGILKSMLHPSPAMRPKLIDIVKLQPFQEQKVKALNYLDTLYQWDNLQKSKFYKGLLQIIPNFPHRVNVYIIVPHLAKEFVNLPMVPFVLPNILLIAETCTQHEYMDNVFPHLKTIFGIDEPIQVLLIFMQKMDILLKLTPPNDIKQYIVPLFSRALEKDMIEVQELCIQALPTLSSIIDNETVKSVIIPRIKNLCLNTTDISIKVKCLLCIGRLLVHIDKWFLLSDILPFLEKIENREPPVIMAIIGIHKFAFTDSKLGLAADVIANKCIPCLLPLCMENSLTVAQFTTITNVIKEMFQKVEKEQLVKLEKLNTINRNLGNPVSQKPQALQITNSNSNSDYKSNNIWPTIEAPPSCKKDDTFIDKVLDSGKPSTLNNDITDCLLDSNPLVLNRQLMQPKVQLNNTSTSYDGGLCLNPAPTYVYPPQYNFLNNELKRTPLLSATQPTKNPNSESSDLIKLTQQDILNFLK